MRGHDLSAAWRRSVRKRAVGASLLCLVAGGLAPELGPPAHARSMDSVKRVLHVRWKGDTRSREQVVRELAGLGPDAIPDLFEIYTGEGLDELLGEAARLEDWWTSPERFGSLALEALAAYPVTKVVPYLAEKAGPAATLENRLCGARVLAAVGSVHGLDLLIDVGNSFCPLEINYRSVHDPIHAALKSVIENDGDACDALAKRIDALDPALLPLVLEACASSGRAECQPVLAALLGRDAGLDAQVLTRMAELESRCPWRARIDCRELARGYLRHADAALVRAAAAALGTMHDPQAVPALAKLLGDKRLGVAEMARWALRRMAGTDAPSSAEEWVAWYDAQTAGWEERASEWQRDLRSPKLERVGDAVRNLSQASFHRHEAARILGTALGHPRPEVARLVCTGLGDLGSLEAVPALADALWLSDDALRASAWQLLRELTDRDLPLEPFLWKQFVEGG